MNPRLIRWLLKSYPAKWRAEYGIEMEDLLAAHPLRVGEISNVLWSGLRERLHEPLSRFIVLSLLGGAGAFACGLILAPRLWVAVVAPVAAVLREKGINPPVLVTTTPWEGLGIVVFGVPCLLTSFVTFAWGLVLIRLLLVPGGTPWRKRWVSRLVLCSGAMFVLSTILSVLLWQHGSFGKLLEWLPDANNAPRVSVRHCFELFALSTLGLTMLLQTPIAVIFGLRFRQLAPDL
jgi:Sec-independent protein secretion pathway component TatC